MTHHKRSSTLSEPSKASVLRTLRERGISTAEGISIRMDESDRLTPHQVACVLVVLRAEGKVRVASIRNDVKRWAVAE